MSKRTVAAAFVAVVALAGCAHRTLAGPTVYKTVTVAPRSTPSQSTSNVAAVASSVAAPVMHALAGSCDDLLSVGTLVDSLGRSISGRTAFVVGLPDRATGRLGYLDCRYGIKQHTPAIEIGVNLYRTPAKAAARIGPTVADFVAHGASDSPTAVAGLPARMLSGGTGPGYGPSVVLADGQRTIVITVPRGTDPGATSAMLLRLAALAERQTAGS